MQQCSEGDNRVTIEGTTMEALDRVQMKREGEDASDVGPVMGGVVDRMGHPFFSKGSYEGYKSAVGGRRSCWGVRF